jgi:hypothetical protein
MPCDRSEEGEDNLENWKHNQFTAWFISGIQLTPCLLMWYEEYAWNRERLNQICCSCFGRIETQAK